MLHRALDALIKCTQDDATMLIEESASIKTYRTGPRRQDRLEGTIQDTNDYKNFFAKSQQAQEDRRARPKPAPGGGTLVSASMDGLASSSSSQPVAAIVLHLRQKKLEERKKKAKKKNAKKNKIAPTNEEGKSNKRKKKKKKKAPGVSAG